MEFYSQVTANFLHHVFSPRLHLVLIRFNLRIDVEAEAANTALTRENEQTRIHGYLQSHLLRIISRRIQPTLDQQPLVSLVAEESAGQIICDVLDEAFRSYRLEDDIDESATQEQRRNQLPEMDPLGEPANSAVPTQLLQVSQAPQFGSMPQNDDFDEIDKFWLNLPPGF
jgi:hypothetical protein